MGCAEGGPESGSAAPPQGFSAPTTITFCGAGHLSRPTATAFYAVGTVTNTGSSTESYVVWLAFKDATGRLMYYSNPSALIVPAGGFPP